MELKGQRQSQNVEYQPYGRAGNLPGAAIRYLKGMNMLGREAGIPPKITPELTDAVRWRMDQLNHQQNGPNVMSDGNAFSMLTPNVAIYKLRQQGINAGIDPAGHIYDLGSGATIARPNGGAYSGLDLMRYVAPQGGR